MRITKTLPKNATGKFEKYLTWQGYAISAEVKDSKFPVYLASIYKGNYTWVTDYLYAKYMTEKTANKHLVILRQEARR